VMDHVGQRRRQSHTAATETPIDSTE